MKHLNDYGLIRLENGDSLGRAIADAAHNIESKVKLEKENDL